MSNTFKGLVSAVAATLLIPFASIAAEHKAKVKPPSEEAVCLQIVSSTLGLQKALKAIGEEPATPLPHTAKYMCHYPETRQHIIKISRDFLKRMSGSTP